MKKILILVLLLILSNLFGQIEFYIETDFTDYQIQQDVYITFNIYNTSLDTLLIAFSYGSPFNYYIDDQLQLYISTPAVEYYIIPPNGIQSYTKRHLYPIDTGEHTIVGELYTHDLFSEPVTINVGQVSNNGDEVTSTNHQIMNFPNPFNPTTTITFNLDKTAKNPKLEIFNVLGQKVTEFKINPFINSIEWNAKEESSGVYFYRIKSENYISKTRRMTLLK